MYMYIVTLLRPSQGFWGTGKRPFFFGGTREQRPNFEGNGGVKTILGNRAEVLLGPDSREK